MRQRVYCVSAFTASARLMRQRVLHVLPVLRIFYNTHADFRLPSHVRLLPGLCRLRQIFCTKYINGRQMRIVRQLLQAVVTLAVRTDKS